MRGNVVSIEFHLGHLITDKHASLIREMFSINIRLKVTLPRVSQKPVTYAQQVWRDNLPHSELVSSCTGMIILPCILKSTISLIANLVMKNLRSVCSVRFHSIRLQTSYCFLLSLVLFLWIVELSSPYFIPCLSEASHKLSGSYILARKW